MFLLAALSEPRTLRRCKLPCLCNSRAHPSGTLRRCSRFPAFALSLFLCGSLPAVLLHKSSKMAARGRCWREECHFCFHILHPAFSIQGHLLLPPLYDLLGMFGHYLPFWLTVEVNIRSPALQALVFCDLWGVTEEASGFSPSGRHLESFFQSLRSENREKITLEGK